MNIRGHLLGHCRPFDAGRHCGNGALKGFPARSQSFQFGPALRTTRYVLLGSAPLAEAEIAARQQRKLHFAGMLHAPIHDPVLSSARRARSM